MSNCGIRRICLIYFFVFIMEFNNKIKGENVFIFLRNEEKR